MTVEQVTVSKGKSKTAIGLFLENDMLTKVDVAAKAKGLTRAAFIRQLLLAAI